MQEFALEDFNGDHEGDLAVPSQYQNVNILFGNGDGTFVAPVPYPAGPRPTHVVAADFNHDGSPDIAAIGGEFDKKVWVLINNGGGTFASPLEYSAGTTTAAIAADDLNGDGASDLVVANERSEKGAVFTLLNKGNGKFLPPVGYGSGRANSVTVADFNGDEQLDIAAARGDAKSIDVFFNQGQGEFGSPVPYSTKGLPHSLVAAELSPGGRPDVVFATAGKVDILPNDGQGSFGPIEEYPVGRYASSLTVADLNSDTALDLAVANDPGRVSILLNVGDGTFGAPARFGAGTAPSFIGSDDLNGDTNADLVVANQPAGVAVLLGKGDGKVISAPYFSVASIPTALAVADFNGDSRKDLAVVQNADDNVAGQVTILLAARPGRFIPSNVFPTGRNPQAAATGDFDHDGHVDLAVANGENDKDNLSIFLGHGNGTFDPPETLSLANYPSALVVDDVNADGKADLAIATFNSGPQIVQATILLGNGDGSFAPPVVYDGGVGVTSGVVDADFNRDHHPDLAIVGTSLQLQPPSTLSIFLGKSDGTFRTARITPVDVLSNGIAEADLNHDSFRDLAIADLNGQVAVLLGRGDGRFGQEADYPAGRDPIDVNAGDMNGDGNPDLVVAGQYAVVTILTGEGNGLFDPSVAYANGGGRQATSTDFMALANFDGHPGLDIVVAQSFARSVAILRQLAPT